MKFYKDNTNIYSFNEMNHNKLTYVYCNKITVQFIKNGKNHNFKNMGYIVNNTTKWFYLYGKYFGNQNDFTKSSWRKFAKLQAFL